MRNFFKIFTCFLFLTCSYAEAKEYQASIMSKNLASSELATNYNTQLSYGVHTLRINLIGSTSEQGFPVVYGRNILDHNKEYYYYLPHSYDGNSSVIGSILSSPGQGAVLMDVDCAPDGCSTIIQNRSVTFIFVK